MPKVRRSWLDQGDGSIVNHKSQPEWRPLLPGAPFFRSPQWCRPIYHLCRGAASGRCPTNSENRRVLYQEVVHDEEASSLCLGDALAFCSSMEQRSLDLLGSLQALATSKLASTWIEMVA